MAEIDKYWKKYCEGSEHPDGFGMSLVEYQLRGVSRAIHNSELLNRNISMLERRFEEADSQILTLTRVAKLENQRIKESPLDTMTANINKVFEDLNTQEQTFAKKSKKKQKKANGNIVLERVEKLEKNKNFEFAERLSKCETDVKLIYQTLKDHPLSKVKTIENRIEASVNKSVDKLKNVIDTYAKQQAVMKKEIEELSVKIAYSTAPSSERTLSSFKRPKGILKIPNKHPRVNKK